MLDFEHIAQLSKKQLIVRAFGSTGLRPTIDEMLYCVARHGLLLLQVRIVATIEQRL
jgi:hypothetical protein